MPAKLAAQVILADSLALVDFYDSTGGVNWRYSDNWKTSEPVSRWYGVTVSNNRVVAMNFIGNRMYGKIPTSFWKS